MSNELSDESPRSGDTAAPGAQPSRPQPAASRQDRTAAAGRDDTVHCPACDSIQNNDRKFCGKCGSSLWLPCTECGTSNGAGELFCGNCGANLAERTEAHTHELTTALEEARRLKAEARFHRAQQLLEPIAQREYAHPHLADLVRQARDELANTAEEMEERVADARRAIEAAKLYASNREFSRARCALEAVPPMMRDEEFQRFLDEVTSVSEEITQLTFEVRRAIQAKKTDNVLPKVERLLQLKPGDEDLLRLAGRLKKKRRGRDVEIRDRACQAAKQSLANFQYKQALLRMRMIPPAAHTTEVARLRDHVEECAWLWHDLSTSPYLDENLVAVARRLGKLQPSDQWTKDVLVELRRRLSREMTNTIAAGRAWARPPKRQHIGCPVDWIAGFRRIPLESQPVVERMRHNPGRLHIAAGLALQGLGRGRIHIDLTPRSRKGVLGRLSGQRKRPGHSQSAWGLDLGTTGLKAVHMRWEDDRAVIDRCDWLPHSKNLNRPEAEHEQDAIIAQTLAEFLEAHPRRGSDAVCVGFPSTKVLGRFIQLPPTAPDKIAEAMQYEAHHQIPLPLNTLVWDYQVLEEEADPVPGDEDAVPGMRRTVLTAAENELVARHVAHFQRAGLDVSMVQSDAVALANLISHEFLDAPDQGPLMIADLGATTLNLAVASPSAVWFRSVGSGADEFAKCLMRDFNLNFKQAEAVKYKPTVARQVHRIYEVLAPEFEKVFHAVQRSMDSFSTAHNGQSVERLFAVGGGFQMHGLIRQFVFGSVVIPDQPGGGDAEP